MDIDRVHRGLGRWYEQGRRGAPAARSSRGGGRRGRRGDAPKRTARVEEGTPVGEAFTHLAPSEAPEICRDPSRLMPRWRDVVVARAGAYAVGKAFGEMFDRTTYLADGQTLMIEVYGPHLPEPGDG